MARSVLSRLLICATLAWPAAASAFDDVVSVSQAFDGTIVVTISGLKSACDELAGTTVSASGPDYTVTSNVIASGLLHCFQPPPLFPYSQSVNLGIVPDGVHEVTWLLTGNTTGAFVATFVVSAGALVGPLKVPALTPLSALGLIALLLFSASRLLVRPS